MTTTVASRWHRPGATLDYLFDWSGQLVDGDTIASKTVTIEGPDGLTADAGSVVNDSTGVLVWVTGGLVDETARVLCEVTTTGGRTDTMALDLRVGYYF